MIRLNLRSLATALFGLVFVSVPSAFAQDPLWRADPVPRTLTLESPEWRGRAVRLEGAEWLGSARRRTVALDLFDNQRLVVQLERRGAASPGAAVWYGPIEGDGAVQGDHVILAWRDGALAGTVSMGSRLLRLRGAAQGLILAEADPEGFAPCAGALIPPDAPAPGGGGGDARQPGGSGTGGALPGVPVGATVAVVDVLTAWTPAARSAAGGTNAMLALIDLAVAEANLAYSNCDAGLFMRLVHAEEVDYTESGSMSTDLSRLRSKTDGFMDSVHVWRDAYGADAVSLITNSGSACGQGYLMTSVSSGFQSSAFNVTRRSCAVGNYTYAHEFGHNFGCAHDPENAGSASHNYAYGYRTPNNQYRSVMAYAPGSRKPIFSSPLHTWGGLTMGTATQDNARALTVNAPTIANWRPTTVGGADCDGDGVPDGVQLAFPGADVDQNGILDVCQALAGNVLTLPLVLGGTQTLQLDAGPQHAGQFYVILGSLGGTAPTTPFLGVDLPLVDDPYFDLTVGLGAGGLLAGQVGQLDAEGRANASFSIPPTPLFQLIATPGNHAFVTFDAGFAPSFVSNPFPVLFDFF